LHPQRPAGPQRETTSIKDIAQAANVSPSTVSRALSGNPLISPATAERIRRIARERGFHVSAAARSLVTGRTNIIGLVVVALADPFVGDVVEAVEAVAHTKGCSVMLATSGADPERELRVVRELEEQRVAGVVVSASHVGDQYLTRLADMKVPIVILNSHRLGETVCSVRIDNVTASETATRYLLQLGHARVAYLGHRFGYQSDAERHAGYLRALDAAGVPPVPELIVYGDSTLEGAMRAMEELLSRPVRPTAVFCYNDLSAIGALRAARVAGLQVPRDVSIMGFDDLPIAPYVDPPLSTVHQPRRRMGELAAQNLFTLIEGSSVDSTQLIRGELIVRESTAPPGSRS
jgi:DNA-binding LacI/PurR family transcriptional regulator